MCGIAGVIGRKSTVENITKMTDSQQHRGPDYTGVWEGEFVCLGHNRLSIIDLSSDANQPFNDNSKRFQIVFNGEIYNYLEIKLELADVYDFKTASDTEVLLAAYIHWGEKCLQKLNGMFSFAIWDTLQNKLFAARDRFGVKPFYYAIYNGNFVFASEIKALHAFGIEKKMNKKIWASYLIYGSYGLPNETFWEGVSQVPGGFILEYSNNKVSTHKWYHFEKEIQKYQKVLSKEEVKNNYVALLKDSIRLRFRADVEVGFNISGGLDSSALLNYVNKQDHGDKINAYTFYTGDNRYDELPWVKEMIALTKNPLHKVLLTADEIPGRSKQLAKLQDEPYGGIPTIAYAKIFEKARQDGVLVLLDGQGMDEQWAGYDYYVKEGESTIQGVNKSPFRKNVLSKEMIELAEKPNYPKPFDDTILDIQYRDLFYTKIPRALRFNDRISMASSTELREPFLDYRLVEFAFAQPIGHKIKEGVQKYILREIVSEDLSDSISYAPKRALQTPQREWLGEDLREEVQNAIHKILASDKKTWFDKIELQKEWDNYRNGDNKSSFHVWQWLNLSLYLDA